MQEEMDTRCRHDLRFISSLKMDCRIESGNNASLGLRSLALPPPPGGLETLTAETYLSDD
jgi:hypothetical protein